MPQPELNRIYTGDVLDILKTWPDSFVDMVLTDPPYNIGYGYSGYSDNLPESKYEAIQETVLHECSRILKPGGSLLYLNLPERCADLWYKSKHWQEIERHDMMFWTQNAHTTNPSGKLRQNTRIWLWWHRPPGPYYFDREAVRDSYENLDDPRVALLVENGQFPVWRDFFNFNPVKNVNHDKTEHPCQLPIEMVIGLIGMTTPRGSIIADPYMGSGTTAVSTLRLNRSFIGIELNPEYVKMAESRIAQEMAQAKLF